MLKVFPVFIYAFLCFRQDSPRIYLGHKQICTSFNLVDVKWNLNLINDNDFVYKITIADTRESFLRRSSNVTIEGSWEKKKDTLALYSSAIKGLCSYPIKYLIRGDSLVPLTECINKVPLSTPVQLDYLLLSSKPSR